MKMSMQTKPPTKRQRTEPIQPKLMFNDGGQIAQPTTDQSGIQEPKEDNSYGRSQSIALIMQVMTSNHNH